MDILRITYAVSGLVGVKTPNYVREYMVHLLAQSVNGARDWGYLGEYLHGVDPEQKNLYVSFGGEKVLELEKLSGL